MTFQWWLVSHGFCAGRSHAHVGWGCLAGLFMGLPAAAQSPMALPSLAATASLPANLAATNPSAATSGGVMPEPFQGDQAISLNFQNIELKALLQVFADFSGVNVVATDGIGGAVVRADQTRRHRGHRDAPRIRARRRDLNAMLTIAAEHM
ncbi:MAG: hypothetical protein ACOVOX_04165, partial [Burkholderiaceae bacterium]